MRHERHGHGLRHHLSQVGHPVVVVVLLIAVCLFGHWAGAGGHRHAHGESHPSAAATAATLADADPGGGLGDGSVWHAGDDKGGCGHLVPSRPSEQAASAPARHCASTETTPLTRPAGVILGSAVEPRPPDLLRELNVIRV